MTHSVLIRLTFAALIASTLAKTAVGQDSTGLPAAPPQVTSPEIHEDGRISFRIFAPKADSVRLGGTDVPPDPAAVAADPRAAFMGRPMNSTAQGIWEITVGPLQPGAYRYHYVVDGVNTVDPRNPATSESNENAWSLVHLPGAAFMDTRNVPRGAIAEITYYSSSLKRFRRMHVYTPPGYESGKGQYPVLYLLHGAMDSDDSWTTVGRAGFILDNLIADGNAQPMVVAMPAGHTGPYTWGSPLSLDDFVSDFTGDVMPLIERHYRIKGDRRHRALAGLSMGGAQTLEIGPANLEKFGYLGVFSSGVFDLPGQERTPGSGKPPWTERYAAELSDEAAREGLQLFWFATGKDDFLLNYSRATVATLRDLGFEVEYVETDGGHTWENWREYLNVFAPRLFK